MRAGIITTATLMMALAISPSQARLWKPTPTMLAGDYTTIVHNKGEQGRVTIGWSASPVFTNPVLKPVLDRYVLISVIHARTGTDGNAVWEDVAGVQVMDGNNQPLKEVPLEDAAPALAGFMASATAAMRQATQGKGKVRWGVYEAGIVDACKRGKLQVTYDGETYSFDTPIPGCETK